MFGSPPLRTEALVIGAGPVGLFQAFQLGLLGRQVEIVDALPEAGGQCKALYADKPIYDIPGLPACSATQLIDNLLEQIRPFRPGFHGRCHVDRLSVQDDGRWLVGAGGQHWLCDEVFIAAGVGAFVPRKLNVPQAAAHEGRQIFYHVPDLDALQGRQVIVVGDGNEALATALELSGGGGREPASTCLMYRRDTLRADAALVQAMQARVHGGRLHFAVAQITGIEEVAGRMQGVQVLDAGGQSSTRAADILIVLQGLSPKLGPLLDWGLSLDRKQIVVNPATFETSLPGVYAVGDINTYPGKRKLIVCGFHEATLAAYAAASRHTTSGSVALLYTTTSPELHRRLGVDTPKPD